MKQRFIYCWKNEVNGLMYVGKYSSKIGNLNGVIKRYKRELKKNKRKINHAMNEHGIEKFSIIKLQNCRTNESQLKAERKWQLKLGTKWPNGYNVSKCGGGWGWKDPEKTRAKISKSLKGKITSMHARLQMSEGQKLRFQDLKEREKLKKKLSDKARLNISKGMRRAIKSESIQRKFGERSNFYKRSFTVEQRKEAVTIYRSGKYSMQEVGRMFNVSWITIHRLNKLS